MGGNATHLEAPQLTDQKVKQGDDVTFRWRANTEASATWLKHSKTLENGGKFRISQLGRAFTLTINNARKEDEGEYTLELSNSKNTVTGSANVEILVPPPQVPQLKDQKVLNGDDLILSWTADTEASATWLKGVKTLGNGGKFSISQTGHVFTLTINDIREEDEGEYTLQLMNSGGMVKGSAKVETLEYNNPWRELNQSSDMKGFLEKFQPANPKAKHLKFLLFGPVGAGKSSLINSINYIFRGHIFVNAIAGASTGVEARSLTKLSKSYKIKDHKGKELPFLFNDTMGLENEDGVRTADIIKALKGHLSEGHRFDRDLSDAKSEDFDTSSTLNDQVHCLVNVIPADKILIYKHSDPIFRKIQEVKDDATDQGIPQVVIMTHVDTCCPLVEKNLRKIYSSKKIKEAMNHCNSKLGIPLNCIFPVKNYHEETVLDKNINALILDALNNIVTIANDYVKDV